MLKDKIPTARVASGAKSETRAAVTIEDVAREMGLAKSTVSRALNARPDISAATREAVLSTALRLGFEPNANARRLSTGRYTDTVALFSLDLEMGVGVARVNQIQSLLTESGYSVPLYACRGDDAKRQLDLVKALRSQRPAAIVCTTRQLEPDVLATLQQYEEEGGIVIGADLDTDQTWDGVFFDRAYNTYLAAKHLIDLGHRKIGFAMAGLNLRAGQLRLPGFERALQEAGLSVSPEWLWNIPPYEAGGDEAARLFLAAPERPTAVCLVNDGAAAAFISRVGRAGVRVPDDLSVVGHDDLPVARYFPVAITTVSHPVEAVARAVADLLTGRLSHSYVEAAARRISVHGELILRESTSAPGTRTD